MQSPIQITFRDMPNSPALEETVRNKAKKLEQICDKIIACRVVISLPQKNQNHGNIYQVSIDLTVPKEEVVVNRVTDENVHIALRNAFDAARRQLEKHSDKMRGD